MLCLRSNPFPSVFCKFVTLWLQYAEKQKVWSRPHVLNHNVIQKERNSVYKSLKCIPLLKFSLSGASGDMSAVLIYISGCVQQLIRNYTSHCLESNMVDILEIQAQLYKEKVQSLQIRAFWLRIWVLEALINRSESCDNVRVISCFNLKIMQWKF